MLIEHALELHNGVKIKAGQWLGFGDSAKDRMRYLCDKFSIRPGGKS